MSKPRRGERNRGRGSRRDADGDKASPAPIRKDEHRSRAIRLQRFLAIVPAQNSALPYEQIGILPREPFPSLGPASHPFADQKEIRMRNRLMVELRLAAGRRVALEGRGKPTECLKRRILRQVRECQADVICMVKRVRWESIALEMMDEFFVGHCRRVSTISRLAPAS